MEPAVRKLLEQADDPSMRSTRRSSTGCALGLDGGPTANVGADRWACVCAGRQGPGCVLHGRSIQRPGPQPNLIDTVFAPRFSNFSDLFTTWSHCQAEQFQQLLAVLPICRDRAGGLPVRTVVRPGPALLGPSSWFQRWRVVDQVLR